jgi:hypothetical protein
MDRTVKEQRLRTREVNTQKVNTANSGVTLGFYFGTGSKSADLNEFFLMCYK